MPRSYDLKYYIRCLIVLFATAGAMWMTEGIGFIVAFPLFVWALTTNRHEELLFCLMLTIAMTMGNKTIMPKTFAFMVMQRSVSALLSVVMIIRIAGHGSSPLLKPFLSILFYWGFMFLPSTLGWCPMISWMKQIFFALVFFAYYGVANSVARHPRANVAKVRSVFLAFATFFIVGSVALIPFPSLGMMYPDAIEEALSRGVELTSLFQGMSIHSQALGPVVSMLGVVVFADLLFGVRKGEKIYLLLLTCVPVLIWKTSSRTAMGSLVLGLCFVMLCFMKARGVRRSWKSKVTSLMLILVAAVSLSVVCIPRVHKSAVGFLLKIGEHQDHEVSVEKITSSRQGTWEQAWANFQASPTIGNGFQISEEYAFMKIDNPLSVLSAPVEKGTWVTAVLEEGGVVGMTLFMVFLFVVYGALNRQHAYIGLSAFFMLLVINLGEFTIFSMTAVGGLLWAMVFVGITLDAQRLRMDRQGQWQNSLRHPW